MDIPYTQLLGHINSISTTFEKLNNKIKGESPPSS